MPSVVEKLKFFLKMQQRFLLPRQHSDLTSYNNYFLFIFLAWCVSFPSESPAIQWPLLNQN